MQELSQRIGGNNMSNELRNILKELTFAPDDNITKSGKIMSGKDWNKDIIKTEKKIKEWILGLLPKELKNNQSHSMFGVDLRYNNGWNAYRNEAHRKIKG